MLLLALAGLALGASSIGATWLLQLDRASARLVALGLLVAAQMQVSVLVCGAALGTLAPGPLLGVQLVVSLLVIGLALAHAGADARPAWPPRLELSRRRPGAPVTGAFALEAEVDVDPPMVVPGHALDTVEVGTGHLVHRARAGIAATVRAHPLHLATVVVVALLYLWHVGLALALPIVDYDGLALHGAAVAHWVRSAGLGESGLSPMVDAAPLGPAAISAWTATFRSDLDWMFLTPLGFVAIGAAAVAQLARRFGASAWDAALGAVVFAALPVVALQATSGYPDLAAASSVVAAWALWAEVLARGSLWRADADARHQRADRRDLVLMGIALGLATAARPANLAAAAMVIALALAITAVRLREPSASTPSIAVLARRAALVVVPLLVLGAYWYVRNAVGHHNPLYPFAIGPLEGLGSVERLLVAPNRPDVLTDVGGRVAQTATSWIADLSPSTYSVDQRLGGLGPIFPLLLLPASAILVISDRRTTVRATFGLALALLVVLPAPWWSRGTLFLPAVGAAALAAVATATPGRRRTALLAATLALTVVGAACTVRESVYAADRTQGRVGPVEALELARSSDPHDLVPYAGYRWLDEVHPDATVAVLEGAVPSLRVPLFGPDLERRVVVVSSSADPADLASSLRAAGADLVLVPTAADELLEEIDRGRGPLVVVAEGPDAPRSMAVVALR